MVKRKFVFMLGMFLVLILSSSVWAWNIDAINPFPGGLNLGYITTPAVPKTSTSYSGLLIGTADIPVHVVVTRLPLRNGLNFLDTDYSIAVYGAGHDGSGRIIPDNGNIYMDFSVTATSDFGDRAGEYTTVLPTVGITIWREGTKDTAGFKIRCTVDPYIEAGPDKTVDMGSIDEPGKSATLKKYFLKIGRANVKVNVHVKTESLEREELDAIGHGIGSFDELNTIITIRKGIKKIKFYGDDEKDIGSIRPLPHSGGLFLTKLEVQATSEPISWGSSGPSDDAGIYIGFVTITLTGNP